jgi:hypothetical protein
VRTTKEAQGPRDADPERGTPRRVRCDNCPKFVMQYRPWQRFCSEKCRRQFHQNEGAFGTLKDKFPKWIAAEVAKQLAAALAQLPPPGPTAADVNNLLLEYDFVSRQELTPEGVAIVRAAGKKKRARPPAPIQCNICRRPDCTTPNEKH